MSGQIEAVVNVQISQLAIYLFFQQITQTFSPFINVVTLSFPSFQIKLLFLTFWYIFQKGKAFIISVLIQSSADFAVIERKLYF